MLDMNRREFIALVGGGCLLLAVKVKRAWGQQPAMPVIGFLSSASPDLYSDRLRTFRLGLNETGYVEGQNVEIDYRWAEGHHDRLPVLAAELVHRQVAVIAAAGGTPSALAAKAATTTIPTVFGVAVDPVEVGLVASLSRPGGNLTGVTNLNAEVGPKRLELLHELLPAATSFGVLVDPTSPTLADAFSRDLHIAAHKFGVQLHVVHASTESDLDKVFATLVQLRVSGLIIGPGTLFAGRSKRLGALSVRHAMPTVFQYREFVAAGGLMSYGSDETEYYRLVGIYVGKILKGEKPGDLPVQQATRVELIVNLKTAKALGVTVPLPLLGRADEVIE